MGLCALTGQRMAITPTVRQEMFKSVCYSERQYIRERVGEWKSEYSDIVDQEVKAWIDVNFLGQAGLFDLRGSKTRAERNDWIDRIPAEAFKAPSDSTITSDMEIVADGLASGAEGLITNNCGTIIHQTLNAWALREGVRNQPFLLNPQEGVFRVLGEDRADALQWAEMHLCAICMVMPRSRRPAAQERELLVTFATRLNSTFPGIGNGIIVEERGSSRDARWQEASEMVRREDWRLAREVENHRLGRLRRAREGAGLGF